MNLEYIESNLFDAKLDRILSGISLGADETVTINTEVGIFETKRIPKRLLQWLACWQLAEKPERTIPIHKNVADIEQINLRGLAEEAADDLAEEWDEDVLENRKNWLKNCLLRVTVENECVCIEILRSPNSNKESTVRLGGRVYLAHWKTEKELAHSLKMLLMANGLNVFMRDVDAVAGAGPRGLAFLEGINEEIEKSGTVVGILTDCSNGSRWFEHEIKTACNLGKPVTLWQPLEEQIGATSAVDSAVMKSGARILHENMKEFVRSFCEQSG